MTTTSIFSDDYPPTMTVEEAAELLGLSRSSGYRAAAVGELPTIRIGRRLLVPTPKLFALLGLEIGLPSPSSEGGRLSTGDEEPNGQGRSGPTNL